MGRRRAGARVGLTAAALVAGAGLGALALALALAGCATVEESASTSTIRELTVTPSDPTAGCAAMLWPVDGALSSPFGRRDGRAHDGIDLAVAADTPVRAACDGIVAYAGNGLRGYGNVLILSHAGALATVYAHNRALDVAQGQAVVRGQIIARSGQTGRASAPHLHFEVRKDSIARDPLGYLPAK
jgi:murein DD-endopeptidase MepM/ murein hydrolase activator NlpD